MAKRNWRRKLKSCEDADAGDGAARLHMPHQMRSRWILRVVPTDGGTEGLTIKGNRNVLINMTSMAAGRTLAVGHSIQTSPV
ncbi:hypothetical protein GN244_ATG03114 [Phytophthora infestans]|uniref:Uncharacterized protein n=1 Tax=Phytophthora infestans TaxID=4787 RepID=A0A833W6M3_PHYIN|nr:hypothetical protein GN244_ATG03114 [Phytophthora infestans]KAF4148221.1 hypothetical protein GN958_ATG02545 [Phytophthora infestans]